MRKFLLPYIWFERNIIAKCRDQFSNFKKVNLYINICIVLIDSRVRMHNITNSHFNKEFCTIENFKAKKIAFDYRSFLSFLKKSSSIRKLRVLCKENKWDGGVGRRAPGRLAPPCRRRLRHCRRRRSKG